METERITLNVGGRLFTTLRSTLLKYQDTMLGRMFASDQQIKHEEISFFDRSSDLFEPVI